MKISKREIQVFELVSKGYSAIEIGKTLFISPETVVSHRKKFIHKLNGKNTASAVRKAYEAGIFKLNIKKPRQYSLA